MIFIKGGCVHYTLNVRSRGEQLVLFSQESWCFPRRSRGKHQDSLENKTNWFPEGSDIKCFVIFLDFHFNGNKRMTEASQNSALGTYNNTNLVLKTTEWMIYKVLSLYYQHLFPPLAAVSLPGWLWKSLLFSLRLRVCVQVVVFINEKENWQCFSRLLSHHSHHALITCCYVARVGYIA